MPPFLLFILSCLSIYCSVLAFATYLKTDSLGGLLFGIFMLWAACGCWTSIWNRNKEEH